MLPFGYILSGGGQGMGGITPYKAIADGTRRHILEMLSRGNMTAGDIASRFEKISRPAVSKHLRILRRSRLVLYRKEGRERVYVLNAAPLKEISEWVSQYQRFWDVQLDAFKQIGRASCRERV